MELRHADRRAPGRRPEHHGPGLQRRWIRHATGPGGGAPGPWFSQGNGHQAVVNFFQRALAVHGLPELSTLNLNALPQTAPDGNAADRRPARRRRSGPLAPSTTTCEWRTSTTTSTLLEQTLLRPGCRRGHGSAAEARLPAQRGDIPARHPQPARAHPRSRQLHDPGDQTPALRLISVLGGPPTGMAAGDVDRRRHGRSQEFGDALGSAAAVPPPDLRAKFIDESAARLIKVGHRTVHLAPDTQTLTHAITTDDTLAFDASGTQDPTGKIAYYTLEVGLKQGCRAPDGHPQQQYQGLPTVNSVNPPVEGYRPGEFFSRPSAAGAGRGLAVGRAGALAALAPNPRNILNVGFGGARTARAQRAADASGLPTLGQKLAAGTASSTGAPPGFAARNVVPPGVPGPPRRRGPPARSCPPARSSRHRVVAPRVPHHRARHDRPLGPALPDSPPRGSTRSRSPPTTRPASARSSAPTASRWTRRTGPASR